MTTYDYLDTLEPTGSELKEIEKQKPKVGRSGAYYNVVIEDDLYATLPVFVRNGINEALRHEESD